MKRVDTRKLAKAAFPDYKGRKIAVEQFEGDSFEVYNLAKSGGSWNEYVGVRVAAGAMVALDVVPYGVDSAKLQNIPGGVVIVCRSFFCGKDCGLRVFVPAPKLSVLDLAMMADDDFAAALVAQFGRARYLEARYEIRLQAEYNAATVAAWEAKKKADEVLRDAMRSGRESLAKVQTDLAQAVAR
jgi:hypothetical protein